jgi:hypothetical protein
MDVGRVLKDSWAIVVKDWGALIVAALIVLVLGAVTLGILAVPLSAGLYLMILRRIREGRKAEIGDVFGCFDRLGAFVVAYLVFLGIGLVFALVVGLPLMLLVIHDSGARAFGGLLFAVALIAAIVVGVYLETVWVYWTILMVDRRRAVIEALKDSRAIVTRSGFWMTLLVIVIVALIANVVSGAVSAVTFGIGGVLTFLVLPWQFAAYTAMYFQAVGESALLPSAFPGPASAWQGGGAVAFGVAGGPYQPAGYSSAPSYAPPGYGPSAGYGPPGPPPGSTPPAPYGQLYPQAPPWASVPSTPPPWAQTPGTSPPAPQAQPPAPQAQPPAPQAQPPAPDVPDVTMPAPPASDEAPQVSPPTPPTPPQPAS